jgi:hypothetical protein
LLEQKRVKVLLCHRRLLNVPRAIVKYAKKIGVEMDPLRFITATAGSPRVPFRQTSGKRAGLRLYTNP